MHCMFAIILVVLGMFFFGGDAQGDAVLASVDAEMWQPAHTDALIYLMHILFCSYYCYRGWCFVPIWSCTERQSEQRWNLDWFGYIGLQLLLFLDLWVVKNHLLFRVIVERERTFLVEAYWCSFILSISCLLVQSWQSFLVALRKIIIINWGNSI